MKVDAKGLACPEPVIRTKTALETGNPQSITVTVDNPASQENVKRFLESRGFLVALENRGDDYIVMGDRDKAPEWEETMAAGPVDHPKKILVFCSTDRLGFGDDELGLKLMISFIKTLKEMGTDLWRLVFVNNGVKLSVAGSAVLPDLQSLADTGVSILVCGTCLTHFNLLEDKQVGETTNMLDIVTSLQLADKVIKI